MAVSESPVIAEARQRAGSRSRRWGSASGPPRSRRLNWRAAGGLDVGRVEVFSHGCNIRESLAEVLDRFPLDACDYVCMTGGSSRG